MTRNIYARRKLVPLLGIFAAALLLPYSQVYATSYPNLSAFYPSSCATNTSGSMDAVINNAFTVRNSGGSYKNGLGDFTEDLAASSNPSFGVNPDTMELTFGFVGYEPNVLIFSGNVPNATPGGSTFDVINYLSSSINVSSAIGYKLEVAWYWETSPSNTMDYWAEIFNSIGQVVFVASYTLTSTASAQWGMKALVPSLTGLSFGTATFTNANFAISGLFANSAGVNSHISVPQNGQGSSSVCGFTIAVSGETANIGTSSPSASGSSYSAHAP
ncbi:MAG: hypothetical protein KGI38_09035 [Thaumarchaeota archaeon]|nr:hypothetical protein [Nitrososphaerota archaeon]